MPLNNSWNSSDPVQVTKGGTGLNTVAQGDLLIASAADTLASLPKDTNATRYLSNTGTNNAPAYAQVDLSNGVTSELPVANGGTGLSTATTAYGVLAAGTTATGAFQNIGTGSAGEVLTSNGAGALPSFQAPSAGAMVLLHTITFNNTASSYDITPYVTGYDIYKFIGSALETPTGVNPDISVQFSTNGGTTWITSGYKTYFAYFITGGTSGSNATTDRIPGIYVNGTATYINQGDFIMTGYGSSSGAIIHGTCMTSFAADFIPQILGGYYFGATLNGIRIINGNGTNYISGKFSIYGIAT